MPRSGIERAGQNLFSPNEFFLEFANGKTKKNQNRKTFGGRRNCIAHLLTRMRRNNVSAIGIAAWSEIE
jgi:hypothetical protein